MITQWAVHLLHWSLVKWPILRSGNLHTEVSQFVVIKFWGIFTLSFDFYLISPQTSFFCGKNKIIWYCVSYYKIQKWRQCDYSYFTSNMNVLQCHLCFNKNLKWRIFKTCDNYETGSPDKLCRIGAMLITGIAAYNSVG